MRAVCPSKRCKLFVPQKGASCLSPNKVHPICPSKRYKLFVPQKDVSSLSPTYLSLKKVNTVCPLDRNKCEQMVCSMHYLFSYASESLIMLIINQTLLIHISFDLFGPYWIYWFLAHHDHNCIISFGNIIRICYVLLSAIQAWIYVLGIVSLFFSHQVCLDWKVLPSWIDFVKYILTIVLSRFSVLTKYD